MPDDGFHLKQQRLPVQQEKGGPHFLAQFCHPGQILIAPGAESSLLPESRAFDVGVGHDMRQLGSGGDDPVVLLRIGYHRFSEA